MAEPGAVIAEVVLGLGVAVLVAASLAALRPRSVYARLHYPSAISTIAGPLLAVAVLIAEGPGLTAAIVVATVLVLAVTGPVLGAAIGRLNAQLDGHIRNRSPR